jgi:hypothetical protein
LVVVGERVWKVEVVADAVLGSCNGTNFGLALVFSSSPFALMLSAKSKKYMLVPKLSHANPDRTLRALTHRTGFQKRFLHF